MSKSLETMVSKEGNQTSGSSPNNIFSRILTNSEIEVIWARQIARSAVRGADNVHFYATEGKDYQFLKSAEEPGGSLTRENHPRESQPNTVNPKLKMAIEQFNPETDPNYVFLSSVSSVIGQRIEPAPRYFMMKNGISSDRKSVV